MLEVRYFRWFSVAGIICISMGLLLLGLPVVAQPVNAEYIGVRQCNDCHREIFHEQELHAHSLALIDVSTEADKVVGDFSQVSDLLVVQLPNEEAPRRVTFEDIAYAVGSGLRNQQYLIQVADGQYELLPVMWNSQTQLWEALTLDSYAWSDHATRYVTGYENGTWQDDGVQCEACHGPGSAHVDAADDAGREIDEDELLIIRDAITSTPDDQTCAACHTSEHSIYYGENIIEQVTGIPSTHTTIEDASTCVSCHYGDGETLSHAPSQLAAESCTGCHTDLTANYASHFISKQQTDMNDRLALINMVMMDEAPTWVAETVAALRADYSGGVHNVTYSEALLNAVELELGLVNFNTNVGVTTEVSDPAECAECHAEDYHDWLESPHAMASLNETFRDVYAENGQPSYCLRCHASGYDANTQTYQFAGVVCSNCHTSIGEHPPAPVTIARDAEVCGTCHSGGHASVYEEWLMSAHADANVDCVDCHTAHTNSLILGDVNSTCGDCHADAMHDEVHGGEDMICTDCHMTPRQSVSDPTMLSLTGHAMDIDPSVCADCHGSVHELTRSEEGEPVDVAQIATLEHEVEQLETRADENLSSGVLGGAIGAVLLFGLIYFVLRLGRMR